jgi:rhodanese-related sulfurtransferase
MKQISIAVTLVLLLVAGRTLMSAEQVPLVASLEANERVAEGAAVLVDVREPEEWEAGVAASAYLLPLSDLRGDREKWEKFLRDVEGKEVLLYCRSGNRSGIAGAVLAREGVQVRNAGSFREWQAAGLPVRQPGEPRTDPAPE